MKNRDSSIVVSVFLTTLLSQALSSCVTRRVVELDSLELKGLKIDFK